MNKSFVITVCARGGSKGCRGKHTRIFNGKPLIQWTVEQAIASKLGKVIVSSDSDAILAACANYKVVAIWRDPSLAKDDTPKLDVIRNAVYMHPSDAVIDLDATNPCRTVADIRVACMQFEARSPSVLYSVVRAKKNPYFNQVRGDGRLVCPGFEVTSRQTAPPVYDLNSSIYIYDSAWLRRGRKHPVGARSAMFEMPEHSFCDIDSEVDFYAAEAIHRQYCMEKAPHPKR